MTANTLDRIVAWSFDPDLYGDERERLRWLEGTALAAGLQWIGIPAAAAVLVWTLGRPAVLPLAVVLAVLYVPIVLCQVYVSRRRVETVPKRWTLKRVALTAATVVPYVAFILGCSAAYAPASFARGMGQGAIAGIALAVVMFAVQTRRRNRRDAAAAAGGDED
ncbi:hypothetical protein [Spirilliplanes yamanashiensis]|uniref:DUF2029 domain-containing protein n=1 Tax=Spirilliplanes yamanashiensis TaxID=42233 RepID=A0A8J3Y509_9ACTN|nr:hypothetical protein [Spirilliplanes yamanashiensis]MDP9819523.1 putative branched-subunit amino acid permease [Spirilliplanes yamanashiensis]GIJ01655.1 hypothetical protein Sya03_10070 [Spirilliplanes yamanashiensis]